MPERRSSIANTLELCLSCTNPSILKRTFSNQLFLYENYRIMTQVSQNFFPWVLIDSKSVLVQIGLVFPQLFTGGRAGGCQTCGTHISVTAWWIFSVRSSMELSRPVVVHCHAHLPICPIWACPWAKNLSNLPQIGSRLCGSHISETAGSIYPI